MHMYIPTTPQSASPPALPRHAYVCHRHYSGALTQGSLLKFAQTLFSATDQCLPCVRGGGPRQWWKGCKNSCVRRRKLLCSGGVGTARGGGRVVNGCICYVIMRFVQTYNPSVSIRRQLPLHRGAYRSSHKPYSAALTNASPG